MENIQITECPRDAMQGLHDFVPTETKIEYINKLLKVGFNMLDFGSFVSPKAIPQMRDTAKVLDGLNWSESKSKLLAIVANSRGASDACEFEEITYLGYPFSVSETFQKRNTNATMEQSLKRVEEIQELCLKNHKQLLVYLSMAFGNPYGDKWNSDIVIEWSEKLFSNFEIKHIALADTIGVSDAENIAYLFKNLIPELPNVSFGAHLHTTPDSWEKKIIAALQNGCTNFDSALKGMGGCPMAKDDLTGNVPTEKLVNYLNQNNYSTNLNATIFNESLLLTNKIFFS